MYYSKICLKVLRKSRANLLDSWAQGWLSYFEHPDYKISADYEIAIVLLHYIHIHICTACTNVCIYGTNSYEVRFINIKYPQLFKPWHMDLKIFKFHYLTTLYLFPNKCTNTYIKCTEYHTLKHSTYSTWTAVKY